LTAYEREVLLPLVAEDLYTRVGRLRMVTSDGIIRRIRGRGYKIDDIRLRKIVSYIRRNDIISGLIASSKGYYIATSGSEMQDHIDSLACRESAIKTVREALEEQKDRMFNGTKI